MAVYIALIILVGIFEVRLMVKERLKKETVLFIALAMSAMVLAWLYVSRPEVSISAYLLKSFGILY
jgi:hypothetical protein